MSEELAWAGGLFEGEGCFHASRHQVTAQITMCDLDILEKFREVIGLGTVIHIKRTENPSWRPAYLWKVGKTDEVVAVAKMLYPYLGERRRRQIEQVREKLRVRLDSQNRCQGRVRLALESWS